MTNYLVFEGIVDDATGVYLSYAAGRTLMPAREGDPIAYRPVCGIRAENPEQAVTAVMRATRRVSRYAVIAAEFIDFGNGDASDTVTLNP